MAKQKEIIKVHFHKSRDGKHDYYFGCLTSMYQYLTSMELGICRQALNNTKFREKRFYANSFCTIELIPVI